MSRPQWIVGDLHAGTDPDADRDLLRLLDKAAHVQVDLILMGDLFVAWLGPERYWPDAHRPILEGLRRVRFAGGRTRLMVGNRDYLAERLIGDVFDEVHPRPLILPVGGRPTWMLHGDGIVADDRAYRAWRRITRNAGADILLNRLPDKWGQRIPEWAAAQLAPTNRAYKTTSIPDEALVRVARDARSAGAARCLMGHFHTSEVRTVQGIPIRIVPGWREHRTILVADPSGAFFERCPILKVTRVE